MALVVFMCTKKKVEKSYEEKREDARRRVGTRMKEFEVRFAGDKDRIRQAEERKRRKEARESLAAMQQHPAEVTASHYMLGPLTEGNFLNPPEPSAASLQTVTNPEGVVISLVQQVQPEISLVRPVQAPVGDETKFEAIKLILGESKESVLPSQLGLTERDLALAFADPMDAIEQEWYCMGFRSLEQEPKVGSLSLYIYTHTYTHTQTHTQTHTL